jgi:hypothetical protein
VVALAVITCGDAALRWTPIRTSPTVVLASTAYPTLPGTRSRTRPAEVVARTVVGGAENVILIWPVDTRALVRVDEMSSPTIEPALPVAAIGPDTDPSSMVPALVLAVTGPDSDPSRMVPTLLVILTAIVLGALMS